MKPSNELISLVNSALNAEAYVETIRPVFDKIHARILEEVNPLTCDSWEKKFGKGEYIPVANAPITRWEDLHSAYDDQMYKCCELVKIYQKEEGFTANPGCSALLEAESLHRDALLEMVKQAVSDFNMPFTYDDLVYNIMKMREFQQLVLKVVVSYCAENNIELKPYA